MGFGSGSGDDLYAEDEETKESTEGTAMGETRGQASNTDEGSPAVSDTPSDERTDDRRSNSTEAPSTSNRTRGEGTPEETETPTGFSEVDVTSHYSTTELAQRLTSGEFNDESEDVPYAMWRKGTSTGRNRTTIELNPDVDELVKENMREFERRYDAEINKSDLREFALVFGLMHPSKVFEMAEEWGLQYNG